MSITPTYVRLETGRRVRRMTLQNGDDVRRMRLDSGISLSELARVVGVHRSHLARIEAGTAHPSLEVLVAIGVALGADLGLRYFPGSGPRLHDRFQAPMIELVLREINGRWRPEVEVPIRNPSRGVIDLVLHDQVAPVSVSSEAYSDLRRLEQQLRWSAEKADGLRQKLSDENPAEEREISRLLILRSTVRTRELARQYRSTLEAAYPARTADVVRALTSAGASWPGPGIVWVHLHGRRSSLMRFPPTGVQLGR
jgi:transcriptional regulator with XRE-family HTH domain